jgi:hypothetical protein
MNKTFESTIFTRQRMEHKQVSCSWCAAGVPLPAGDEVGVCIECGAVVFRDEFDRAQAEHHSVARSFCNIPTPA